jgi:putative membrane protein
MYEGHWIGGGFMWLFWILLIVVAMWGIKYFLAQPGTNRSDAGSALSILKERYAKGEIGREEFEQKKRDLM